MGGSSSSSGGGGGSSRNTNYVTFPSGKRVSYTPYVKDSKGRPIRTGSGGYVRRGTYTPRDNDNDRGSRNNNPAPAPISQQPVPPPSTDPVTPDDGTGSGKILNPTVFLLQREQRNRRLGRNFFSLLGVQEQFTGARRNILF